MKLELQHLLKDILKDFGVTDITPDVTISDNPVHGEYTTNAAMKVAAKMKNPPDGGTMGIALQVKESLIARQTESSHNKQDHKTSKQHQKIAYVDQSNNVLQDIERIEIAPPGFINIFLTEVKLSSQIAQVLKEGEAYGAGQTKEKKKLMVEYTDPNPFKELHIGHLYSNAVGESLARLYEKIGWSVKRADYFGDVGMHVAKSIWGLKKKMADERVTLADLEKKPLTQRVKYLGAAYSLGATAYEEETTEAKKAKEEMKDINYMVYLAAQENMQQNLNWRPQIDYRQHVKVEDGVYDEVRMLFETGRSWSMEYFEGIFRRLGTKFDYYYPESIVGEYGTKLVREHTGDVFEESDGAIVYRGEKDGLHTRVFMNALGLPTYEAKELGLNWKKFQDYQPDLSFNVTGNEINEYFKVLFVVMHQVIPDVAAKTRHIGHGMVRLSEGKMSSRTGKIISGEGLLEEVKKSIYKILDKSESKNAIDSRNQGISDSGNRGKPRYTKEEMEDIAEKAAIAAIKYSMLRVSLPSNIAFDFATSLSFDGDSGPYLLYTYARCRSVLRKSNTELGIVNTEKAKKNHDSAFSTQYSFNPEEREVARMISFFPEIVAEAAHNLAPNMICGYLFKLAQTFNLFYQKHPILNPESGTVNTGKKHKNHDSVFSTQYSSMLRLALTAATAQVLHNGLHLLGIETVERM